MKKYHFDLCLFHAHFPLLSSSRPLSSSSSSKCLGCLTALSSLSSSSLVSARRVEVESTTFYASTEGWEWSTAMMTKARR